MKQTQLSFDVFSHTCLLFHSQHFEHLSSYLLQDFWSQGLLPEIQADHLPLIARASSLHDIGKCALSEQIVHGTTKLSPLEYEIMKQHTTLGGNDSGPSFAGIIRSTVAGLRCRNRALSS